MLQNPSPRATDGGPSSSQRERTAFSPVNQGGNTPTFAGADSRWLHSYFDIRNREVNRPSSFAMSCHYNPRVCTMCGALSPWGLLAHIQMLMSSPQAWLRKLALFFQAAPTLRLLPHPRVWYYTTVCRADSFSNISLPLEEGGSKLSFCG